MPGGGHEHEAFHSDRCDCCDGGYRWCAGPLVEQALAEVVGRRLQEHASELALGADLVDVN